MFSLITNALLKRRSLGLLGMSVRDFAELASSDPAAASTIIRSVSDILFATGKRLLQKSEDVTNPRRAKRLRRRAEQRLELSRRAALHAQDLMYRAEGEDRHCTADPLREPLT